MQLIVNRLTADLNNYRSMANHWQQQYIELTQPKRSEKTPKSHVEASTDLDETFQTLPFASPGSSTEIDLFGTELLGRLDSTANPTLFYFDIGPPKLYSNVSNLVSNSTFRSVLIAVNLMASLDKIPELDLNTLPRIDHLKPEFDTLKAFRVWNDIFEPMNFQPSSTEFDASPSCRRTPQDMDDADTVHLDRVLARSSDNELIDLLQYATLLVGGMHQTVFEDPSMAPARLHLGRSLERIIGEAIFSRNLSSNSALAASLLDGLVGTACHFTSHGMKSAVLSVLNLAWMTLSSNSAIFLPTVQVFLASYLLIISPPSQRDLWTQRINDGLAQCSDLPRPFPALLMASLSTAYSALLSGDENTVLHHSALLESLLAPADPSIAPSTEQQPVVMEHTRQPCTRYMLSVSPAQSFYVEPYYYYYKDNVVEVPSDDALPMNWFVCPTVSDESLYTSPAAAWNLESNCLHFDERSYNAPGENLKSIYRISLFLIRAESSLQLQDFEKCTYWVDEAERLLLSIPLECMFQRVFLMKNVIKTTCPFPTGERSVVDEFERRLLSHDLARCGLSARDRTNMSVLWRTP